MGNRVWLTIYVLFLVTGLFSFVLADENASAVNSTSNSSSNIDKTNIEKAFDCLVTNLGSDCSGAKTVQQLSFSILASPNITSSCVDRLLEKKQSMGCFSDSSTCGIKETAWAILALYHAGENVESSVSWLINQSKNSSDVEWFLQQDSDGDTKCKITYDDEDYLFDARENKKLESSNLGPCFVLAQSDYWLRLSDNCLGVKFTLSCNKESNVGWSYRAPGSSIWNILADSQRTAPNTPAVLEVKSHCFGVGSDCNFEDTAWAALALKDRGEDIDALVPYIISAEESNSEYLPAALNYLVLEWSNIYGNKLVQQQIDGQYWQADNSEYGEIYDTALALLAIGSQKQDQVENAKDWLLNFKQDSATGCWNNKNIRDTAFVLWVLEKRQAVTENQILSTTRCVDANFFCTGSSTCTGDKVGGKILSNYYCGGLDVCCDKNPVLSCEANRGTICSSGKSCNGSSVNSLDGACCLASCIESPSIQTSQCGQAGYSCRNFCLSSENEKDYSCSGTQICCAPDNGSEERKIPLWIWLLVGILLILIILAIIFRNRIKAYYYKFKNRKNGGSGSNLPKSPPFGSRPGFPPLRPIPPQNRQMLPNRPIHRPPIKSDQNSQDVFAKLKEMSR